MGTPLTKYSKKKRIISEFLIFVPGFKLIRVPLIFYEGHDANFIR